MKRARLAIWLSLFAFATSCVQILDGDHPYTASEEKNCTADADCEDMNPCTADSCGPVGVCVNAAVPDGPSLVQSAARDCKRDDCVSGKLVTIIDDEDVPTDTEPCTNDVCTNGVPSNETLKDDAPCKQMDQSGTCQMGTCTIACGDGLPPCNDGNPCTEDVCNANTAQCAYTPIDGTPTPGAMDPQGNCTQNLCVKGIDTLVPDNGDLPIDGNSCTDDICNNGVYSNPPTKAGVFCQPGEPEVCDGNKNCVECTMPQHCVGIVETDCTKRDCVANKCVPKYLGQTTAASVQIPGNCKKGVCNGIGGVTTINDDTDLPNDNNACTADSCVSGVPTFTNEPATKTCGPTGMAFCDGMGFCTGCEVAADCAGTDDFCKTRTCINNLCGFAFTPDNTALPSGNQTAADCMVNVCDGMGNPVARPDTTDIESDGNPCTKDQCSTMGTPTHTNEVIGVVCNTTTGDICDGNGSCKRPNGKTCNNANQCAYNQCVDGYCCNSACTANCQSCSVTGSIGTCTSVPKYSTDGTCSGTLACDGTGNCKKVVAQTCTSSTECASGVCADGVCCSASCSTACKSCNLTGSVGTCSNVLFGNSDSPLCAAPAVCNGSGVCLKANGGTCTAGTQCQSMFCVDGVCCGSLCLGTCQACNVTGSLGTCTNSPAGADDTNSSVTCSGATVSCDGNGSCKKENGQACTGAADCLSGQCVDGYCCNTACAGACQACNITGFVGTCTNVPLGQTDAACATTQACDGAGVCKLVAGQTCGASTECVSGNCTLNICQ